MRYSVRMQTKLNCLLAGIAFAIAVCCTLFPVLAADEANVPNQFQFTGGDAPLGDTALHTNWKLVWQDDFSKDQQIDRKIWNFELGSRGASNHELEYYTDNLKNASITNGQLAITARSNDDEHRFTSARMTTRGKFSCLFGRIEACIKVPHAQAGNWPAFWMLPEDSKYGRWPRSGEIDIMEVIDQSNKLYGTAHFGGEHLADPAARDVHAGAQAVLAHGDFSQDFHVYAVEWEAREIRWYVDGKYYGSIHTWHSSTAPYPAPFDQKFFIILNFAIGGDFPGPPNASSTFPQSMCVKYVRVYQP
jgi:beta-glucanase (GH16 family)